MFIRYNEALDFWEYDTSPGQTGAGPWLLLPVDASKLGGSVVLPSNIAYKDQINIFTQGQAISNPVPYLRLVETGQPINLKNWRFLVQGQLLFIQTEDDTGGGLLTIATLNRNGDITVGNHLNATGELQSIGGRTFLGQKDSTGCLLIGNGTNLFIVNGNNSAFVNVYGSTYYERGRSVPMGEWQFVAYNAANFSSSSGLVWTVPSAEIYTNTYTVIGKTLIWHFFLNTSTLSGAPGQILIMKPPVPPAYKHMPNKVALAIAAGAPVDAYVTIYDPTSLGVYIVNGANWPLGALRLVFTIIIEIA